ncbi:MAG: glycogen debranching protein [Candidatus Kuenenia sp.]|nr:glycogen debranching protein [Candidatus Kuenenia hertensis]
MFQVIILLIRVKSKEAVIITPYMKIIFKKNVSHTVSLSLEKEWLETNGIGGYASSTIIGANTRRYHGLLLASTKPPLGRILMLSKLEESLRIGNREYSLSTNIYPNTIYPEGYKNLVQFQLDPFPVWAYSIEGMLLKKTVFMVYGENTTVILYQTQCENNICLPPVLSIRFMISFRDYHSLTYENPYLNTRYKSLHNGVCLSPYQGLPSMYLYFNTKLINSDCFWYKNMEYPKEIERGMEAHEDHFSPFAINFDLKQNNAAYYIVASTEHYDSIDINELYEKEIVRRNALYKKARNHQIIPSPVFPMREGNNSLNACMLNYLLSASDTFIVRRGNNKKSIIAGYHWFSDWGRDTMISLPGLTLVQGKYDAAKEILLTYADYVNKGMIPNRFPDSGESPEYNTVDASLWYIHAVYQYYLFSKDALLIKNKLYSVLQEIISYYKNGTRYNIHMDRDGLIFAGEEGVQLTWMDAKVGDLVVTPRIGKPVEINALWYNALVIMSFFAKLLRLENDFSGYAALNKLAGRSFNEMFWFEEGGYLYDSIDGEIRNSSIRPNQIFAVSLPFVSLPFKKQQATFEVVKGHLLTPYGLRSLSPSDKEYIGAYIGNLYSRDKAYHQGTVWAWLIGPYLDAFFKIHGKNIHTQKTAVELLQPLFNHIYDAGIGTVSEIFDGDYPHIPRGCISQAWSVGELLRLVFEYLVK